MIFLLWVGDTHGIDRMVRLEVDWIELLVCETWLSKWPRSTQYIYSRQVSNHCALVVKNRMID